MNCKRSVILRDGLRLAAGLVAMIILLPIAAQAQFLRLTFEIESELVAEEMTSLYFGEVVPNTGVLRIELGDPDMGTYAITGPQNLTVDINLDIPEYLELEGEEALQVPMNLEVAYANRNENTVDHALPVTEGVARFPIHAEASPQLSPDDPVPSATAYLYVYGEIEVGDIPTGTYEAEVFMAVEYE